MSCRSPRDPLDEERIGSVQPDEKVEQLRIRLERLGRPLREVWIRKSGPRKQIQRPLVADDSGARVSTDEDARECAEVSHRAKLLPRQPLELPSPDERCSRTHELWRQ